MWGGKRESVKTTTYLLMDRDSNLLAMAELDSPPGSPKMQMRVTRGQTSDVEKAGIIQAVSTDDSEDTQMARVLMRRGSILVAEPLRSEVAPVRKNVRISLKFDSFVYPEGAEKAAIKSVDLSMGGIAYLANSIFFAGAVMKIDIPLSDGSVLTMDSEIVRVMPHSGQIRMYACQFVNVTEEQGTKLKALIDQHLRRTNLI